MREFDIEQASLHVKWNYGKLLSALPVTGTEAFGILCDQLAPFGLDASKIFLEAPSTKLGDVVLTIILLDGRLEIKFWISSFEILVYELYEDDEPNIVDITKIIFDALKRIDENVENGTANVRLMYHLKLMSGENTKFLMEHLKGSSQLIPEMAIYRKSVDESDTLQQVRVAIAKSQSYDDSLFLDVNLNYSHINDIDSFKELITQDIYSVLTDLGLADRMRKGN